MDMAMELNDRIYTLHTLVDITPTGMIRNAPGRELERNQQRNWETVLQCIGLIAQPTVISWSIKQAHDITEFGEMYHDTKSQTVWTMSFSVDHEDVFRGDGSEFGALERCFNEVPIIPYLVETAKFILPIFYSSGAIKNIYFKSGITTVK